MNFFELSITGLIVRFYLLMAVVLVAGFTGVWALALLGLPIFLSCMNGVTFGKKQDIEPLANSHIAEAEVNETLAAAVDPSSKADGGKIVGDYVATN